MRQAVRLALAQPDCGAVLVLLDGDADCPAETGSLTIHSSFTVPTSARADPPTSVRRDEGHVAADSGFRRFRSPVRAGHERMGIGVHSRRMP